MKKLLFALLVAILLIACQKNGDDSIELTGGTSTSQKIYADETQKSDGIKFTAKESWKATVTEVKAKSGNDVEWLKLSATEGGAGDFTISMTLTTNTTGEDRKAEIKIISGGTSITIVVEQKGTTQSGDKPIDSEKPIVTNYITQDGKVKGGEIMGKNISTEIRGSIGVMWGDGGALETTPVAYSNKTFDITLPTPADKYQGAFQPDLTITPSSTKFSYGNLEFPYGAGLDLTNVSWENANNELYRVKKGEGNIVFVYASQDATIDGSFTENGQTMVFKNCKVRKGWNELAMIAAEDFGANGTGTINISMNESPADFRWVAVGDQSNIDNGRLVSSVNITSTNKVANITYIEDISYNYDSDKRIRSANRVHKRNVDEGHSESISFEYDQTNRVISAYSAYESTSKHTDNNGNSQIATTLRNEEYVWQYSEFEIIRKSKTTTPPDFHSATTEDRKYTFNKDKRIENVVRTIVNIWNINNPENYRENKIEENIKYTYTGNNQRIDREVKTENETFNYSSTITSNGNVVEITDEKGDINKRTFGSTYDKRSSISPNGVAFGVGIAENNLREGDQSLTSLITEEQFPAYQNNSDGSRTLLGTQIIKYSYEYDYKGYITKRTIKITTDFDKTNRTETALFKYID